MTSSNRQVSDNLQSLCGSKTTQISFKQLLMSYLFEIDDISIISYLSYNENLKINISTYAKT